MAARGQGRLSLMVYQAAVRSHPAPAQGKQKILVVEDSRTFSMALRRFLESETRLPVTTCDTVKDLREITAREAEAYAIAVVDLNLPDAPDGEALDCTVQHGIPTIVFTGSFDPETRNRIMKREVIDYVVKDNEFALPNLVNAVKRALANQDTHILLVDDLTSARGLLARMLKIQQYSVFEAGSGAEALSLLESNPEIRLVISDYNMPDIDGYELTRRIRRRFPANEVRVIGISSSTDRAVSAGFLKAGANDFISRPFVPEELQCRIASNAETLAQLKQLRELASRDHLTGLFNRRYFFEHAPKLIKAAAQAGGPSAVAVLDIDHFKRLNDGHGHEAGDRALELIASCLERSLERSGHLLARIGGEEFAILFPGMAPAEAMRASDHIRLDISHLSLQIGAQQISVTASIGIAEARLDQSFGHYLSAADRALYAAKEKGRNRVEAA